MSKADPLTGEAPPLDANQMATQADLMAQRDALIQMLNQTQGAGADLSDLVQ